MKKYLIIIAFIMGLVSCAPESTLDGSAKLSVAESKIEAKAAKGVYMLTVTSDTKWRASCDSDWLFLRQYHGEGNGQVEVEILANKDDDERSCVIVIKGDGVAEAIEIPVIQASAKGLLVERTVYEIGADGGNVVVDLQTNTELSAAIDVEWITMVEPTRAMEARQMVFAVAPNSAPEPRTATITLSGEDVEDEILTITQSEANALVVEKTTYEVAAKGGDLVIDLKTNVEITAAVEEDWITLAEATRAMTARQLVFVVAKNDATEPRTATVILSGEGVESITLTITQNGAKPAVIFADANFKTFLLNNNYDTDGDGEFSQDELDAITSVTLWRRVEKEYFTFETDKIDDLSDLQHLPNLEELDIQGVPSTLTEIDLSRNTKLRKLNCANTSIASFDLSNNTELVELNLSGTPITSVDLYSNTKLTKLELRSCESLNSLDVSNLSNLTMLNCAYSKLTALNVAGNTQLVALYCNGCGLAELNVSTLVALERLVCDDNSLTQLDASNNLQLKSLTCTRNNLTLIKVNGLSNLKRLAISHNPVSELSLVGNLSLQYLHSGFTNFTTIDVAPATALLMLNVNDSKLASVDLSMNTALRGLRLNNNALASLDLTNNSDLRYLFVDGNPALEIIDLGDWFNASIAKNFFKDEHTKWGKTTEQGNITADDMTDSNGSWAPAN